jgi:signal peptidase II
MQSDPETPAPMELLDDPADLDPLPPPALLVAFPSPTRVPVLLEPELVPAPAPAPVVQDAHPRASVALLLTLSAFSLAADLATKLWAKEHLAGPDMKVPGLKKIDLVKGHLDLIFAQNPGGAWSFLRSLPDSLRRPFFLIVSAAAIVFIISVYRRVRSDQWGMKLGLPLALGGAIGNLVDRIRYGWVIDFIDYRAGWMRKLTGLFSRTPTDHWPTFNVADIAIVAGVLLMAVSLLRVRATHPHGAHGAVSSLPF